MHSFLKYIASISFTDRKVGYHSRNIDFFVINQGRNRLLNSIRKQKKVFCKDIFRLADAVHLSAHSAKKIRVKTTHFPKGTMVQCTSDKLAVAMTLMQVTLSPYICSSDGDSTEVLMFSLGPLVVTLWKNEILGSAQGASVELIPLESNLDIGLQSEDKAMPKFIQKVNLLQKSISETYYLKIKRDFYLF